LARLEAALCIRNQSRADRRHKEEKLVSLPLRSDPARGYSLPFGHEDLTPTWLTAVLRDAGAISPSVSVSNIRFTPIGNGMLGTSLRLEIEYSGESIQSPAALVVKLAAAGEQSRSTGVAMQLYLRETRFYQELAPRARLGLPKAWFADVSADASRFCLLFENLAPARSGDQIAGCSPADALLAMDAAASLHAPSWGDAAVAALPWLQRQFSIDAYSSLFKQFAPVVASRFGSLLPEKHFDVISAFADRIDAYFAKQDGPWTVTHQDFRLDNMLFNARGGVMPLAVLDWQTVLLGPGVTDVAYFIGGALLPEGRREHELALVQHYHRQLLGSGVRGYDWDHCWSDYRLFTAQGLITAVAGAMSTSPTERGDRMFAAMLDRHVRHMLDHDCLSLIR